MNLQPSTIESPQASNAGTRRHANPAWRRKLASVSRWLHIYLSMGSFGILFFFAVTGLTLNHTEWFAHQQKTTRRQGKIKAKLLNPTPDKLQIVETVRQAHGIHGALSDFRIDDSQCSLSFKGPGYAADIFVDRGTGAYDLMETRNGFWAVMNDLHKGRDSGKAWAAVIDVSAILMTLVSITGLVLIFFIYKKRTSGLILLAIGAVVSYALYAYYVP